MSVFQRTLEQRIVTDYGIQDANSQLVANKVIARVKVEDAFTVLFGEIPYMQFVSSIAVHHSDIPLT